MPASHLAEISCCLEVAGISVNQELYYIILKKWLILASATVLKVAHITVS